MRLLYRLSRHGLTTRAGDGGGKNIWIEVATSGVGPLTQGL